MCQQQLLSQQKAQQEQIDQLTNKNQNNAPTPAANSSSNRGDVNMTGANGQPTIQLSDTMNALQMKVQEQVV